MSVENILAKLEGVKRTANDRWMARCPAHEDKRPSLAIRELPDGRILLHDFGGCPTVDVMLAIGMPMWTLFPDAAAFHAPQEGRPFPAMDVLRACATEALVAATSASNLAKGIALSDDNRARLWQAATRLQNAFEVASGQG